MSKTPKYNPGNDDNKNIVIALDACFGRVFKQVVNKLRRKYSLDYHRSEDFASQGLAYAARLFQRHPQRRCTAEDLSGLGTWKAGNLAKDWLASNACRNELVILDEEVRDENGELLEESPLVSRYAVERWQNGAQTDERNELGEIAWEQLDAMFDRLDLSPLRREVFRAIYLEDQPVAEVCARHGIKANYAYGIVHGVKAALVRLGAAFDDAA